MHIYGEWHDRVNRQVLMGEKGKGTCVTSNDIAI